jgi:hypothetical protein
MCLAFARTATTPHRLAADVGVPAQVNVATTTTRTTTGTRWRMRLGVSD